MRRNVAVGLTIGALLGIAAAVAWSHQGEDNGRIQTAPWDRWEKVNDRTIRLFATSYHTPSCYQPDPRVGYSTEAVTITLRFRRTGEFCTLEGAIGGGPPVIVHLDEDLGNRSVLHG